MKRLAASWEISQDNLSSMIRSMRNVQSYEQYIIEELNMPKRPNDFLLLIRIALVNGVLEDSEMDILKRMGRLMRFSEESVATMVMRERKEIMKMGQVVKVFMQNQSRE